MSEQQIIGIQHSETIIAPIIKKKTLWDEITVEDMNKLIEGCEKFYEERNNPKINIFWLANAIIKRLRNDSDFWAVAEGLKGRGKSNLILLLTLIMSRYAGLWKNKVTGEVVKVLPRVSPPNPEIWEQIEVGWKFKNNMSFLDSHSDVKLKYNKLDRYGQLIIDEGSKNLHKYNWQSKTQFMLVQMSDTERYQNKCCIICFPNFKELNPTFRNDRIQMRLFVYHRSTKEKFSSCIISLKDENRHIVDPWHTDENAKRYEEQLKKIPLGARNPYQILNAERKLKGFAGSFDFPSIKHISPKIWRIYMTFKIENAQREFSEIDEKEIEFEKKIYKWKFATNKLIHYIRTRLPDVTLNELHAVCALTPSQINTLKNEIKTVAEIKTEKEL